LILLKNFIDSQNSRSHDVKTNQAWKMNWKRFSIIVSAGVLSLLGVSHLLISLDVLPASLWRILPGLIALWIAGLLAYSLKRRKKTSPTK
jgi:hypothetical protein